MNAKEHEAQPEIADFLSALSRISTRAGDPVLARVRLQECLGAIDACASPRVAAAAFQAAAELANSIGQFEHALEFYCACFRMLGQNGHRSSLPEARDCALALRRLRSELGDQRFGRAWAAARRAPFPLELNLDRTRRWLDGLDPLHYDPKSQPDDSDSPHQARATPGTTAALILRANAGSDAAREDLAGRHLESLRRFGHGRLPRHARDLMDTDDLVQVSVERGLHRIDQLKSERKGGFFAYLRKILLNLVRDEIRRTSRRPRRVPLSESMPSPSPSPLEELLGREASGGYESALFKLPSKQRTALDLRIEQGFSYQEVADAVGCPSANAARMLVARALKDLAGRMTSARQRERT